MSAPLTPGQWLDALLAMPAALARVETKIDRSLTMAELTNAALGELDAALAAEGQQLDALAARLDDVLAGNTTLDAELADQIRRRATALRNMRPGPDVGEETPAPVEPAPVDTTPTDDGTDTGTEVPATDPAAPVSTEPTEGDVSAVVDPTEATTGTDEPVTDPSVGDPSSSVDLPTETGPELDDGTTTGGAGGGASTSDPAAE